MICIKCLLLWGACKNKLLQAKTLHVLLKNWPWGEDFAEEWQHGVELGLLILVMEVADAATATPAAAPPLLKLGKQLVQVGQPEQLLFRRRFRLGSRRVCRRPRRRRRRLPVHRGRGEAAGRTAEDLSHVVHGGCQALSHKEENVVIEHRTFSVSRYILSNQSTICSNCNGYHWCCCFYWILVLSAACQMEHFNNSGVSKWSGMIDDS